MRPHCKIIFRVAGTLLAAGVVVLAGCKEPEKYLRATPGSIEIAADVLEASVTVEATASWMAHTAIQVDWLQGYRYDDEAGVLWINVAGANTSLEARSAEITIVSGDGLTTVIPLVQLAMDAHLDVSPGVLDSFDGQGKDTRTLTVATKNLGAWEFSKREDWLLVTKGEGEDADILTIGTEPSRALDPRRDTIIVRPVNDAYAALADTIPVVQNGLELVVDSDGYMDDETFIIELPAEGIEAALTVYARAAWTVSANDPEGLASLSLSGGDADIETGTLLVLTLPENISSEEHSFTLTFLCTGETYQYQVVQAAAAIQEDVQEDGVDA